MLARIPPILAGLLLPSIGIGFASAAPTTADPLVPWVEIPDDGLRAPVATRVLGRALDRGDWGPGFWQDGMYFGAESYGISQLAALGLPPVPGMAFAPTPGILYLEMGGVTLSPYCGTGESANAAVDCSPLVSKETVFPAYGTQQQQQAVLQKVTSYYAPFDLVVTTDRPPDYMHYTMAVIGGSASNAGQGGGVCGVANVACDGLKRNHVSLTFPSSCGGVAEVVAQETSHNWGLEHTSNSQDLLYPYNNGGTKTFVDQCMNISHATGNGVTQCSYVHKVYCPTGDGEQQNSRGELLGVFGPRSVDGSPPAIVDIQPPNGSRFTTADEFLVTARVEEDSNFAGVKWTWSTGLPPEYGDQRTRCTNKVCDDVYELGLDHDFSALKFDFIKLVKPPAGTYTFTFEVMDAYGNADEETIVVTVVGEGGGTTGSGTDGSTGSTGPGSETGDPETDGTSGEGTGTGSEGDADGTTSWTTAGLEDGGDPQSGGCACASASARPPWAAASFVLVVFMRRRRAPLRV